METDKIQGLKHHTVDQILRVGVILIGVVVFSLFVRDYPDIFSFRSITNYSFFLLLIIAVLLRERLNFHIKTNFIIWVLFLSMVIGLSDKGYQSTSKVFIILVPVLTSFLYSYRKSNLLLALFVLTFLFIGYLWSEGHIVNTENMEITYKQWIAEAANLVLAGYILLLIGHRFKSKLFDTLQNLESIVKTRTADLEMANEELITKNEIINNKNIEINIALNELKETQSQLLQKEKMASLGILTAGVAHEINNPLNYIMGAYIGLGTYFEDHGSKEQEKTELLLNSINIGVERIADIVQGLNQFSRNNECMDEPCDIHTILDNCFAILNNRIKYKAIVERDYTQHPIVIKGNVGKMHEVFLNIITNAIQAIGEKGKITATTSIEGNKAKILITDDGIGIEKDNLSLITDPFFTTNPPGEGTGLGLSITYSIIKEHKGSIEFESELKKGTTVRITLPININENDIKN